MEKLIGRVVHFFPRAGVIVIKLEDNITLGETIKVKRGEEEFEQTIDSMQVEHKPIQTAKAGEEVAIKVSESTKAGAEVYKIEN